MAVIASHSTTSQSNTLSNANSKAGQSFTCNGYFTLDTVTFRLYRASGATGNIQAKIYEHDGTYGTSSVPTGDPIAVSDNLSISGFGTSFPGTVRTLSFSGANKIILVPENYVVTLEAGTSPSGSSNYIKYMNSVGGYSGNQSGKEGTDPWFALAPLDMNFSVNGTATPLSVSLSGSSSMSGTASVEHYLSVSGTFGFTGNATPLVEVDNEATERKTYMFKVYDLNDNFAGIWDDVVSPFQYSHEVNSAGASTNVRLARSSDSLTVSTAPLLDSDGATILDSEDRTITTTVQSRNQIGPGSTVNHNYRVEVWVFYGELSPILDSNNAPILDSDDNPILGQSGAPNGRRIFNGFISEIESQYGDEDNTIVELTSFGFDLDQYIIEDEGDTKVAFNSFDPSDIVRNAMTDFNSRAGSMNVTTQSVATTGTTVSYTFNVNTYLEVLKKAVELAPADWYWYADLGQNLIFFQERPETSAHTFYLGKHIQNLRLRSYIGDVVNDVYFSGGEIDDGPPPVNLFKRYTDTPATNTRVGLKRFSDNRVLLEDSAQILSEGEIERNNRVQYRSEITILAGTYDIEDIKLGELVAFRNFDNYVDSIALQIVAIQYAPERVTLQLDTLLPRVSKRLEDLKRNLDMIENQNNPDAPT